MTLCAHNYNQTFAVDTRSDHAIQILTSVYAYCAVLTIHICLMLSIRQIEMSMCANVTDSHNHMKFKISAILKILVFFSRNTVNSYVYDNEYSFFFSHGCTYLFSSEIIKKTTIKHTERN